MLMTAERERTILAPEDLGRVRALYEEGQCLRAYELGQTFGPLDSWGGTAARLMAGGLAAHLGAPRLGTALHVRAYRDDARDPEACFYYTCALLSRRGPLRTWDFLKKVGPLPEAPDRIRGFWLSMHATVLGYLRDFDAAETWLARAEEAAPEHAWLLVQRSSLFETEDRYDDALATSREALARRPGTGRPCSRWRISCNSATATRNPSRCSPRPWTGSRAAQSWRSSVSSRRR